MLTNVKMRAKTSLIYILNLCERCCASIKYVPYLSGGQCPPYAFVSFWYDIKTVAQTCWAVVSGTKRLPAYITQHCLPSQQVAWCNKSSSNQRCTCTAREASTTVKEHRKQHVCDTDAGHVTPVTTSGTTSVSATGFPSTSAPVMTAGPVAVSEVCNLLQCASIGIFTHLGSLFAASCTNLEQCVKLHCQNWHSKYVCTVYQVYIYQVGMVGERSSR